MKPNIKRILLYKQGTKSCVWQIKITAELTDLKYNIWVQDCSIFIANADTAVLH